MQVMLQRAPEVNRVTNNDGSRAENQNQAFAQSLQDAVDKEARQVVNSNQAQKSDVDKDGGKEKKGHRRRSRQDGKNDDTEEKEKEAKSRSMLDIRI